MKCTDCNGTGQIALLYSIVPCDCVNRAKPAKDPYRGFVEPEAKMGELVVRDVSWVDKTLYKPLSGDLATSAMPQCRLPRYGTKLISAANLEILKARAPAKPDPGEIAWGFAKYPGAAKLDEDAWYSPRNTMALGLGPYWQTPEGQAQLVKAIQPSRDAMSMLRKRDPYRTAIDWNKAVVAKLSRKGEMTE